MSEAHYKHVTSTVADAAIHVVWAEVRDIVRLARVLFGDAAENVQWQAGGSVDRVPSAFSFNLAGDPTLIEEEVTGRSEADHTIQYRARGQVLTMVEYAAEIRLYEVTTPVPRTFIRYARTFRLVPGADPAVITNIMDGETVALHTFFAEKKPLSAV